MPKARQFYSGQKFGHVTLVAILNERSTGVSRNKIVGRCVCGEMTEMDISTAAITTTFSCGCKGNHGRKYDLKAFLKSVKVGDKKECWEWFRGFTTSGYGIGSAHRRSWNLHKGEVPKGLFVLHACNNKKCVNPDHLYLGTHEDNMRDLRQTGIMSEVNSTLTPGDIKLAKRMRKLGYKYREIAETVGVTKSGIWAALKREEA